MSPPVTEDAIIRVLERYRVAKHYLASTAEGATRYAVFSDDGQLTEPVRHARAQVEMQGMIARDLLVLLNGQAA